MLEKKRRAFDVDCTAAEEARGKFVKASGVGEGVDEVDE